MFRPSSVISYQAQEPSQTRKPSYRNRKTSCRNREPSRNFKPNPLLSPRGYSVLIPLTVAGLQVLSCVNYHSMLLLPLTRIEHTV